MLPCKNDVFIQVNGFVIPLKSKSLQKLVGVDEGIVSN